MLALSPTVCIREYNGNGETVVLYYKVFDWLYVGCVAGISRAVYLEHLETTVHVIGYLTCAICSSNIKCTYVGLRVSSYGMYT